MLLCRARSNGLVFVKVEHRRKTTIDETCSMWQVCAVRSMNKALQEDILIFYAFHMEVIIV